MKRTRCTARIEHGRTKTKPHGVTAACTRVRIYNEAGDLLTTRWVCAVCRERMLLPDRDVDFRPGETEVSDEIVDDDPTSCECGWRAESPDTHPHVTGCPLATIGNHGPEEWTPPADGKVIPASEFRLPGT